VVNLEFKTTRDEFIRAVKALSELRWAEKKGFFDVPRDVIIYTRANELFLASDNPFVHMEYRMEAEIKSPGRLVLNFPCLKKMSKVLALTKSDPHFKKIESQKAQIVLPEVNFKYTFGAYENVREKANKICVEGEEDYVSVKISELNRAAERVSILKDSYRGSFFLGIKGTSGRVIGLTPHRVLVYDFENVVAMPGVELKTDLPFSVLKVFKEASKDEEGLVRIYYRENLGRHLVFKTDRLYYQGHLGNDDKDWLYYEKLLPDKRQAKLRINRKEFKKILEELSVYFADKKPHFLFTFSEDELGIDAIKDKENFGHNTMPVQFYGEPGKILVSGDHILDGLNHIEEEEVFLEISGQGQLVLLEPLEEDQFKFRFMPLKEEYCSEVLKNIEIRSSCRDSAARRKEFELTTEHYLKLNKNHLQQIVLILEEHISFEKMPWLHISFNEQDIIFRLPGKDEKCPGEGDWKGTARVPTKILRSLKECCANAEGDFAKIKYGSGRIHLDNYSIEADWEDVILNPGANNEASFEKVLELYAKHGIEEVKKRGLYQYAKPMEEKFRRLDDHFSEFTFLCLGTQTWVEIFYENFGPERVKKFIER
jgi:DNA polymerase III sliding clamp (beta) subunit (PCNA family)